MVSKTAIRLVVLVCTPKPMPVWRHARVWAESEGERVAEAFVRLSFAREEAHQFDWSQACVVIE